MTDDLIRFGRPEYPPDLDQRPIEDRIAHYLYHSHMGREAGKDYTPYTEVVRRDARNIIMMLGLDIGHELGDRPDG